MGPWRARKAVAESRRSSEASPYNSMQAIPPSARKNFVLDTNVLLHDPNSLLSFANNSVLIPIEVIEKRAPSVQLTKRVPRVLRQLATLAWVIRVKSR
jgi:PhoH-like ATPase